MKIQFIIGMLPRVWIHSVCVPYIRESDNVSHRTSLHKVLYYTALVSCSQTYSRSLLTYCVWICSRPGNSEFITLWVKGYNCLLVEPVDMSMHLWVLWKVGSLTKACPFLSILISIHVFPTPFLWPLFMYVLLNISCHLGSTVCRQSFQWLFSDHFHCSHWEQSCHPYINVTILFLSLVLQICLVMYLVQFLHKAECQSHVHFHTKNWH